MFIRNAMVNCLISPDWIFDVGSRFERRKPKLPGGFQIYFCDSEGLGGSQIKMNEEQLNEHINESGIAGFPLALLLCRGCLTCDSK